MIINIKGCSLLTWDTEEVRVTQEKGKTHALIGIFVTLRPNATHNALTTLLAAAIDTHLRVLARVCS